MAGSVTGKTSLRKGHSQPRLAYLLPAITDLRVVICYRPMMALLESVFLRTLHRRKRGAAPYDEGQKARLSATTLIGVTENYDQL